MGKIICRFLTRGKHKFKLIRHYYRCVYCDELRMHVTKKVKDEPPFTEIEDCNTVNCTFKDHILDAARHEYERSKLEPQKVKEWQSSGALNTAIPYLASSVV